VVKTFHRGKRQPSSWSWPAVAPGAGVRAAAQDVRSNVGAKMRDMWR
jgi:hypothetical protein